MKVSIQTVRGVAFAFWKVWTLDGGGKAFLKTESALVQVHGTPKKPVVTVVFLVAPKMAEMFRLRFFQFKLPRLMQNATPPKFNSQFTPEKWWLEDDLFLLGIR